MTLPSLTPAFDLLLQSVRLDDKTAATTRAQHIISSGAVDWDDLLIRAELHCIRPQIGILLNNISSDKFPDYVKENLDNYNRENLLRQLRNITEFFKIKPSLDKQNIPAIPFKGFWIAHKTYGNLADRESGDVDLYTQKQDLGKIKDVMLGNGYLAEALFSPYNIEEIKSKFGEYNFDKIEDNIIRAHLEFHWRFCGPAYGLNISYDDLASQIVTGEIQNHKLSVFTPTANLLLAVMHHGGKDPFTELKHVYDIAMIIDRNYDINWDWAITIAKKHNVEKLLYIAVKLASVATGVVIPEQIRDHTESNRISRLANNRFLFLTKPAAYREKTWFKLNDWFFRIRSRTSMKQKIKLTSYIARLLIKRYLPSG